jgi:L-rhamnose isomerase / sugar isomerase
MIDQSHIDKPKIEAMIQTVSVAQELYAKAAPVDHAKLTMLQERNAQIDCEELLRDRVWTDVRRRNEVQSHGRSVLPQGNEQAFLD